MRGLRDFGNALVVALLSIGLTFGALSISLVGFIPEEAPPPTQVLVLSPIPVTATNTFPPTATLLAAVDNPTSTATNTIIASTFCQSPQGWIPIYIQSGETLDNLALRYNISKDILKNGNCLIIESLVPGKIIYVPPAPTSTVQVCIQGASGWIRNYIVQPGDTFFNISPRYGTTANNLKFVNCHPSDLIYPGDVLWVPNVPTRVPTITPPPGITYTVPPYLTPPFTQTILPYTGTPSATQTSIPPTATPTATGTPVPTYTASPTAFPSNTPTSTPTPTNPTTP